MDESGISPGLRAGGGLKRPRYDDRRHYMGVTDPSRKIPLRECRGMKDVAVGHRVITGWTEESSRDTD